MKKSDSVYLKWQDKDNNPIKLKSKESKYIKEIQTVYPYKLMDNTVLWNEILEAVDCSANGRLIEGMNLEVMLYLLNTGYKGELDLIYLDPPYFSESSYDSKLKIGDKNDPTIINRKVFKDSWDNMDQYLDYIFSILQLSKELLSDEGSLFIHLDWHICHYVKILLDEIFSRDNFINEIIWCYGGGSNAKRNFHRKHDTIFWYGKSDKYIFNPQYRPYTEKTKSRGLTKVKGPKYVLNEQGALMQDWWTDINKILSPTAYENLKFPTQKPAALLERIVKTASNEGSIVGDFFMGSGTIAEVAEKLNRNWLGCDNSNIAIQTTHHRLINNNARPYRIEWFNLSHYGLTNIEVTLALKEADLIISLSVPGEPLSKVVEFWEVGIYEETNFKSLLQVIRSSGNYVDLPHQVIIKNITVKEMKIGVKVYDFWGNIFMQKYQL